MKHLKLFENFSEIEICKKYGIKNYTINGDGSIDVDGDVILSEKGLTKLPLRFRNVTGYFSCRHNNLTTLEGSPKSVGGDFYCYDNKLTTLEGSPQSVGGDFNCCYNNQLTTLEGSPQSVGGNFNCYNNQLTTLEGSPQSVGGHFNCNNNQLTTLEGSPSVNILYCRNNNIVTLEGCPEDLTEFHCDGNPVYKVWKLFQKVEDIEYFNYCLPIQDGVIHLYRLNTFLEDTKKPTVTEVEGYKCII